MKATDVQEFLSNLEGGVLQEALGNILSDIAFSVRNNDSRIKGRVNLSLSFEKLNDNQVMITHKIDFKKPTSKGSISEDRESQTPMYVNKGGELSIFSKDQGDMFAPNVTPIHKVATK